MILMIGIPRCIPMGRGHTPNPRIGRYGGDDYIAPTPKDAEWKLGPNHYKRGLNNKIFIWRGEWKRCLTITEAQLDKEKDKQEKMKRRKPKKGVTLAKINADLLKRIEDKNDNPIM